MSMSTKSGKDRVVKSRYSALTEYPSATTVVGMDNGVPIEGRVWRALDSKDTAVVAHTVGVSTESIPLAAVAVAIGGAAVISPEEIVTVYVECGKLDVLAAAVAAALPPAPPAPKK